MYSLDIQITTRICNLSRSYVGLALRKLRTVLYLIKAHEERRNFLKLFVPSKSHRHINMK